MPGPFHHFFMSRRRKLLSNFRVAQQQLDVSNSCRCSLYLQKLSNYMPPSPGIYNSIAKVCTIFRTLSVTLGGKTMQLYQTDFSLPRLPYLRMSLPESKPNGMSILDCTFMEMRMRRNKWIAPSSAGETRRSFSFLFGAPATYDTHLASAGT